MAENPPELEDSDPVEPRLRPTAERRSAPALSYLGFQTTAASRDYTVSARVGVREARRFVVSIEHGVFARGEARFQDAPDLCYAKLTRELERNPELDSGTVLVLTAEELSEYRERHRPPGQRRS